MAGKRAMERISSGRNQFLKIRRCQFKNHLDDAITTGWVFREYVFFARTIGPFLFNTSINDGSRIVTMVS